MWWLLICAGSDKIYEIGRKLELDSGLNDFFEFENSWALLAWGLWWGGERHVEIVLVEDIAEKLPFEYELLLALPEVGAGWGELCWLALLGRSPTILVCPLENARAKTRLASSSEGKLWCTASETPFTRGPASTLPCLINISLVYCGLPYQLGKTPISFPTITTYHLPLVMVSIWNNVNYLKGSEST